MPIKPTVSFDKDDMVRFMLYQQFYYGGDRIYGRTKDMSVFISGSGAVIDAFYDLINEPINLINKGNYTEYLNFFNENIHPIPVDKILKEFKVNSEAMGELMEKSIKLTIIVGKSLLEIHQVCFNTSIDNFIKLLIRTKEENFQYKMTKYEAVYRDKLRKLYSYSDPIIGLIYSLSFLQFLAKRVGNDNISSRTEDLLNKYYKELAEYSDFNLIR